MSTNEKWRVDPDLPTLVIDQQGEAVAGVFYGHPKGLGDGEARVQLAEKRARLIALAPAMAKALAEIMKGYAAPIPGINNSRWSRLYGPGESTLYKAQAILAQLEANP